MVLISLWLFLHCPFWYERFGSQKNILVRFPHNNEFYKPLYLRIFIDIKSTFKVLDYIVEMFFPMAVSSFCTSVAQLYRGAVPVFAASFVIMFTVFFGKVAWAAFFITIFGTAYMLNIASIIVIAVTRLRYFDKWMLLYFSWNDRRGFLEEISNTSDWKTLCKKGFNFNAFSVC